uniref:Uncharacterized protein n=1 Tax=Arundo donax TaxID=35708 RepID=A0A0A9CUK7_ARUDO
MLEKEKDLIAEKNPQARVRRSMRKSVMPVNDNKVVGEEIQNAKGDDVEKQLDMEKQLVVKQPARRSSRKSAPPDMLENKSGFEVAETNAEARVKRSMRKSVLPNVLNKENPDHSKMTRNEDFQSSKGGGEEKQRKVKEPIWRTRRSVATVVLGKENEGLHEEKKSEIPMRRSTRKSVAFNAVEKGNMDHTEMVGREQSGIGTRNLKARGQLTDRAVATPENKLQVEVTVQNKRPAKRSRTTTPEAVMSVEEAKFDGMVTKEATHDGDKVTHKYNKESSRIIQEICQFNATGEEFSADPLLVTHDEETCIVQRVHKVIPGSESGHVDNGCQNSEIYHSSVMESSDKCKQAQGHFDIQISDSHLSETRVRELDKKSSTAELVSEKTLMDEGEVNLVAKSKQDVNAGLEALNKSVGIAQEIGLTTAALILESEVPIDEGGSVNAETVKQPDEEVASPISSCCDDTTVIIMEPQFALQNDSQDVRTEDVLPIDFTVGDREEQSPVTGQGRAGGEAHTSESGEKNLADIMSTGLHTKDVVPIDFTIEEHEEEQYPVSPIADEKRVSREENASELAGKTVAGIMSTGLHTKGLHDCDVPAKETGEASELALPISDSKQEVHSDAIAEQSIRDADLGNCLGKGSQGNPLSTNLHSQGVADDIILPVLSAAKGCSSDGRHSSFDLKFLFAEECKESYSRNDENTAVEVDSGNKPIASETPSFCVGSDCDLEDEGVEPIVYDADKKVDADQGAAQEEVVAVEISNDEHVAAKLDLETMFNDDCSLAEKNIRLVADNLDGEQAMVQVQQGDVHEGTFEKPSLCPATLECEHECGLPKEAVLHSVKNRGSSSSAEQSPFCLQSLFSQENMEESVEYSSLASATPHIENGGGELKDCHVTCAHEKNS